MACCWYWLQINEQKWRIIDHFRVLQVVYQRLVLQLHISIWMLLLSGIHFLGMGRDLLGGGRTRLDVVVMAHNGPGDSIGGHNANVTMDQID